MRSARDVLQRHEGGEAISFIPSFRILRRHVHGVLFIYKASLSSSISFLDQGAIVQNVVVFANLAMSEVVSALFIRQTRRWGTQGGWRYWPALRMYSPCLPL